MVKRAKGCRRCPRVRGAAAPPPDKNHVLANLDHYLEKCKPAVTAAGGSCALRHRRRRRAPHHRHLQKANAKQITKRRSRWCRRDEVSTKALIGERLQKWSRPTWAIHHQLAMTSRPRTSSRRHPQDQDGSPTSSPPPTTSRADRPRRALVAEAREVLRGNALHRRSGHHGRQLSPGGRNRFVGHRHQQATATLTQTLAKVHRHQRHRARDSPRSTASPSSCAFLARSAGQGTEAPPSPPAPPQGVSAAPRNTVVLLDSRSKMLGSRFRDMLRLHPAAAP